MPSIVVEKKENVLSHEISLLMDCMFNKDPNKVPIMEQLRHEGLKDLHDNMDRQSDGITCQMDQRDAIGFVAFFSMEVKMHVASLLRGNLTLWHDLSDWTNKHLDSMTNLFDGELNEEGP